VTDVLSTCRLQLHAGFPFAAAGAAVPHLSALGVTHVYASPVLRARRGSSHGYDVTDPREVNPELGGEDGFRALVAELRRHGMGLVLDIVPNHMAAVPDNPAWQDVLSRGRDSAYARWFDVDWDAGAGARRGKVLLPVLEDWSPRVLEAGRLALAWEDGRIRVRYGDAAFPTDPLAAGLALEDDGADAPDEVRAIAAELAALGPARRDRTWSSSGARPADAPDAGSTRSAPQLRERRERAEALLDRLAELAGRSLAARNAVDAALGRFAGPAGARRLRRFLDRQPYALVHWRRARGELNYRRFFDVNDLVGLRVEDQAVFEETHAKVLAWAEEGLLDGVRVDHVDGLLDPLGYLRRLTAALAERVPAGRTCPVWVEKVLSPGERLPAEWPAAGTTGYEFLNLLESALLDAGGAGDVESSYRDLTRRRADFAAAARRGKRAALTGLLATDLARLTLRLRRVARRSAATAHLRRFELGAAVVETIVHLPVYRTYVDGRPGSPRPEDRELVARAVGGARAGGRASGPSLDLVEDLLLLRGERGVEPEAAEALAFPAGAGADRGGEAHGTGAARPARNAGSGGTAGTAREGVERLRFVLRFQQTSGPATAKGVEDTALYVHVPLLSRNEVGGSPDIPLEGAVPAFHDGNAERARRWPASLLCTSTHDTKRSGDVRARLDVLAEVPAAWRAAATRWHGWSRRRRRPIRGRLAPSRNDVYLLHQTLVGVWPLADPGADPGALPPTGQRPELRSRLAAYALKAAREAKVHTSWLEANTAYEEALTAFAEALVPDGPSPFLEDVAAFVSGIARPGLWNALARTVVHLCAPGVPDLYQGDELWTFSLVDPDNRRPVDFDLRRRLLAELDADVGAPPAAEAGAGARAPWADLGRLRELVTTPEDGRLKLHVTRAALHARRRRPRLFRGGGYVPLEAAGPAARHVLAFARLGAEGEAAVVAVPRLPRTLVGNGRDAPAGGVWGDTRLALPPELARRSWTSALDGRAVDPGARTGGNGFRLAELLDPLPAALLLSPR
jgi:(1->4)-alpha-D-glucan 1-alpha-D-glucosylmutase